MIGIYIHIMERGIKGVRLINNLIIGQVFDNWRCLLHFSSSCHEIEEDAGMKQLYSPFLTRRHIFLEKNLSGKR